MSGFDLATLAAVDVAPVHLKGPNGEYLYHEGKPCIINLYGPGSDQAAEVDQRQTARVLKRMADNDGKPTVGAPDERDAETAEDLAAITHSFDNVAYSPAAGKDGKALFRAFYADRKMGCFTQQVQKAHKDWGKFLPASSGN